VVRNWRRPRRIHPVRDWLDHKAFTGVLLADMHLRGEVSLDDPLPTT